MIFTERTITVVNDSATINKPLILYRGDKNIELKITIVESQFKFRSTGASNVIETANASYAQLVINTPYNSPIFSEVTATENGTVIFVISAAMIDEVREVGIYDIQIRLLDDNKQSRVTIPPVSNAIEIREPMAIEDGSAVDSNTVNVAKVNRALTTTSAPLEAFDSQGNYIKKTWGDGDPITDAALNKMEAAIDGVNKKIGNNRSQIKEIVSQVGTETLPTTSQTLKGSIRELFQYVSNGKTLIASAITDMGVTTLATATFEQMANNIRQITTGTTGTGDYTDISYIESTGTQYINTRIVPTASTKIELVAEMSASKAYDHIFGSDNFMKVQWIDDTGTAIEAVKKNGQNQVSELTLGKHTYVMDMADTTNAITIDGINYGANIGHVESTTNSLLLLSGYNNDGTVETEFCGIGKIYSCKIYYEDTLMANMKPILTNRGTYGLLDTVNNTLYASEVGNFTGPVPK